MKLIRPILFTALVFSLIWSGIAVSEALRPVNETPTAPPFTLPTLRGEPVSLGDYRGKPLIVNFWATWCPPCIAEMPSMDRAFALLKEDGIGMLAINVGETKEKVEEFLASHPAAFPVLLDPKMEVHASWRIRGMPTTYVLDGEGRMIYIAEGGRKWDSPRVLDKVRGLLRDESDADEHGMSKNTPEHEPNTGLPVLQGLAVLHRP